MFKSVNIWQSYKQERECVMHFLYFFIYLHCVGQAHKMQDNHTLACNFAKYSLI